MDGESSNMKQQFLFYLGKAVYTAPEIFLSFASFKLLKNFVDFTALSPHIASSLTTGALATGNAVTAALCLYGTYMLLSARFQLYKDRKAIQECPLQFPLECVDRVVIQDTTGLERLLNSTNNQKKEWGTLLKSHAEGKNGVIDTILDPSEAIRKGLIGQTTVCTIYFSDQKIAEGGYNGAHHYHPSFFGAASFGISFIDRGTPKNWLNILTFKLGDTPELIAYNKNHIYLPTDASKKSLVRASKNDVVKYIKEYETRREKNLD